MHRQIQILLVDDHSLFRESLSRLLEAEPDYKIVGSCGSATEAIRLLKATPVDLVLLDYDLGDEQGSGFLAEAKRQGFTGKILMVTAGMSDAGTLRALEGGAAGFEGRPVTDRRREQQVGRAANFAAFEFAGTYGPQVGVRGAYE
jgi:DNA-binding NarL/FixJ family response regulator